MSIERNLEQPALITLSTILHKIMDLTKMLIQ